MKALFKEVDSGLAIIHKAGLYRQLKLYTYEDGLYAGNGLTFMRLNKGGSTSTEAKWVKLNVDYIYNKLGQLKITQ